VPKSLRQLLDEYERDILMRMDPVRKELAILERDLADVRKAKNAIESESGGRLVMRLLSTSEIMRPPRAGSYGGGEDGPPRNAPPSPYAKLTMKQLVRKALGEHFPNGATAAELLDFFANAWGRNDIVRTSLSPQLSRLKQEGIIILRGKTWFLAGTNETLALQAPEKTEPPNANAEDGS
jgi:hypothetical protein